MRFAFKTSPQNTTWDAMLEVWRAADDVELFESGWTFDHFYPILGENSSGPCMEGWVTLTALAQATRRLRLGTLVTGIHYRHPAVLANMAATLDIISGGRLELGIGAGWNTEESGAYGIALGTPKERSDRLEEACEVLTGLLGPHETTSFKGSYYELTDAGATPSRSSNRIRRSASAAAVRSARCAQPRGSPSIGTSSAAHPTSSGTRATCCTGTVPTSAAIRQRSSCPATCNTPAIQPRQPLTPPLWQRPASSLRSSTCGLHTWRPCWSRWPMP
jgi:hypothetical protein